MPAPEPDLDVILPLLWPDTWRDGRRPDWVARRNAAAVALCWLCGATVAEMGRVRIRDWETRRRQPGVRLSDAGGDNLRGIQNRVAPAPEAALLVVNSFLRHSPLRRRQDAPLIPGLDGGPLPADYPPVGEGVLARATAGRVRSMRELTARYRRYLDYGNEDADVVLRLSGRALGLTAHLEALADDDDPRLARLVARVHPLGGKVDRGFSYDPRGYRRF